MPDFKVTRSWLWGHASLTWTGERYSDNKRRRRLNSEYPLTTVSTLGETGDQWKARLEGKMSMQREGKTAGAGGDTTKVRFREALGVFSFYTG